MRTLTYYVIHYTGVEDFSHDNSSLRLAVTPVRVRNYWNTVGQRQIRCGQGIPPYGENPRWTSHRITHLNLG